MTNSASTPSNSDTRPDSVMGGAERDRMTTKSVAIAYAFCCAEGGGNPAYCDCAKPDHGTAWREVRVKVDPAPGTDEWLKSSPNYHPGDLA